MEQYTDYCGKDPTPLPCTRNLGIKRINMPQINNANELKALKRISQGLGYEFKDKFIRNIKNKPIFTSQKEINETKASNIPVKIYKNTCSSKQEVPVIMLKNKKGEYMVVDGHHRWLAHYLKNANLKIVELNTNSYNLEKSFHDLNNELKRSNINFHKGHSINGKKSQTKKKINTRNNKRKSIRRYKSKTK